MNIEEIKEALGEADRDGIPIDGPHTIIRFLLAECQKWQEWHDCEYRERKKYRQDANHFAGEVQRLTAELKEREAEVEKLTHERDLWENMAAMRLADQEDIERHTRRVVAREICEYLCKEWPFMGAGAVMDIKERYGVE